MGVSYSALATRRKRRFVRVATINKMLIAVLAGALACVLAGGFAFAGIGKSSTSNEMVEVSAEVVWASTGSDMCPASEADAATLVLGVEGSYDFDLLGGESVLLSYALPSSTVLDVSALTEEPPVLENEGNTQSAEDTPNKVRYSDAEGNSFTVYPEITSRAAARLAHVSEPTGSFEDAFMLVQIELAASDVVGTSVKTSVPLLFSEASFDGSDSLCVGLDGALLSGAMVLVVTDVEDNVLSTLTCDAPWLSMAAPGTEGETEADPERTKDDTSEDSESAQVNPGEPAEDVPSTKLESGNLPDSGSDEAAASSLGSDISSALARVLSEARFLEAAGSEGSFAAELSQSPVLLAAGPNIASGTSGYCDWVIDSAGKLSITVQSGRTIGQLGSLQIKENVPWLAYASDITSVYVGPGVEPSSNFQYAFYNCTNLVSADLSNLRTRYTYYYAHLFDGCASLTSVTLPAWNTGNTNGVNFSYMFQNCSSLASINLAPWASAQPTNLSCMFKGCTSLESLNLSSWNTSRVTNFSSMFYGCTSLASLTTASTMVTSAATDLSAMFQCCTSLPTVNVSNWNTSNVTNMSGMFQMYSFAPYTPAVLSSLDVSNWNTGKVTNMSNLFSNCVNLETLGTNNVRNWNTGNVTNMGNIFASCESLEELDVSQWNTSKNTNFTSMFLECASLESLDVSNFVTTKGTTFNSMFNGCTGLTTLDCSYDGTHWNTSNATAMGNTFANCTNLTSVDVSGWNTAKVTNFQRTFYGCTALHELDLSSFDTSSAAVRISSGNPYYGLVETLGGLGTNYENGPLIILGPDFKFKDEAGMRPSDTLGFSPTIKAPALAKTDGSDGGNEFALSNQQAATTPQQYMLGFKAVLDANGGTFSDGTTQKVFWFRNGSPVSATAASVGEVSKAGETLQGWDTEANNAATRIAPANLPWETEEKFCSYCAASFDDPVITLYAEWPSKEALLDTGTAEGALLYKTIVNGSTESDAPDKTFSFTVESGTPFAPLPSGSVSVDTTGDDTYLVDMGELSFKAPGVYRYVITEAPGGLGDGGWQYNATVKYAEVTVVNGEDGLEVSSVKPVVFTNIYSGGKYTADLGADDISDDVQLNWQAVTSLGSRGGDVLSKGAEWTDQNAGEAQISLSYNTPIHTDINDAVYLFTNCEAHNFNSSVARANIQFLVTFYEKVDCICACSIEDSGVKKISHTFYAGATDAEIDAYLSEVAWTEPAHLGAVLFLSYLQDYLGVDENGIAQGNDPDGIYLSFDGARGLYADKSDNGNNYMAILREAYGSDFDISSSTLSLPRGVTDQTMQYLADKQMSGSYYLLMADHVSHPDPAYDYENVCNNKSPNLTYLAWSTVSPVAYVGNNTAIRNEVAELYAEPEGSLRPFHLFTPLGDDVDGDGEKDPLNVYPYSFSLYQLNLKLVAGTDIELIDVIDPRFDLDIPSGGSASDTISLVFADGSAVPASAYAVAVEDEMSGATKTGTKVKLRLRADINDERFTMPVTARIAVVLNEDAEGKFQNPVTAGFDETNIGDAEAKVYDTFRSPQSSEVTPSSEPVATLTVASPQLYKGEKPPAEPVKKILEQGKTENIDGQTLYTGKTYTYSISWENTSSNAQTAKFTDVLPEDVTFVSASAGGTYDKSTRTVTWSDVSVAAGDTATVTFDVTVNDDAPGKIVENEAVVNNGKVDLESNETENLVKNTPLSLPFPTTGKGGFEIVLAAGVLLLAAAVFCTWRIRRSWQ